MRKCKLLVGILAITFILAGCGSTESNITDYSGVTNMESKYYEDSYNSSLVADSSTDTFHDNSSEGSLNAVNDRKLIRTVSISVEDNNISNVETIFSQTVQGYGGYVQSTYYSESGEYYDITYRIPSDKVDVFLQKTKEGYDVTSLNDNVEDVTLSYTDVESRLASKKAAYKQYQELMKQASSVEDIVSIQSKMDEITSDIESYESQMRSMKSQIEYTEVRVNITTKNNKVSHIFDDIGDKFLDSFEWFIETTIHLIFVLPIIFVVIFVIVKAVRFARRKKSKNIEKQNDTSEILHN